MWYNVIMKAVKNNSKITAVVWKEGKYFVSQCLNIDVASFGKTKSDALKKLNDAVSLYFRGKVNFRLPSIKSPSIELQVIS